MSLSFVEKRDGRRVPFDKSKIAGAVARAQQAVGEDDAALAGEVADLVELTLRRRHSGDAAAPSVPGIEEIQDLVEQALIELGYARLAKAYILYRDRRARIREVLEVHGDRGRETRTETDAAASAPAKPTTARRAPRVQLASAVAPWSKGRIVAALMQEADLSRHQAEEVASRVEERVLESGFRRISTALIRELVDNELVEMGLAQALSRQRPVGIPRHDLRALFARASTAQDLLADASESGRAHAPPVETAVAGEILRRYALEDVLPEPLAEMHLTGELWLEDLDRPHLALTRALPAELLLTGEPGANAAFDALAEIARQARACAYGLVVEDAAFVLQGLLRGARASTAFGAGEEPPRERRVVRQHNALAHWLSAIAAVSRAAERRLDLVWRASNAAVPAAWLARLVDELDLFERGPERGAHVRLFVDGADLADAWREIPLCAAACERLMRAGRLVPTWESDAEQFAGPGLRRAKGERGALSSGGAAALNLPRVARRAGPWREDLLLEGLADLVAHALDALSAVARFQRTTCATYSSESALRFRTSYALVPVGLREALVTLGDGELSAEQGARIVAFLSEAASRFGRERGLAVTVTPYFGARARAQFAAFDARHFHVTQPNLFDWQAELGAPQGRRSDRVLSYSCGFDLGPDERSLELETALASLCASVASGALHAPLWFARGFESAPLAAEAEVTPCVEAWQRIDRARERLRQRSPRLFALPQVVGAASRAAPTLPFAPEPQAAERWTTADIELDTDARGAARAPANLKSLRLSPDTTDPHEPCV